MKISFIFFLFFCFFSLPVFAEESHVYRDEEDDAGILTFNFENDYFADRDRHFTNGVRFSWLSAEEEIPKWLYSFSELLPFFDESGQKRYSLSVGQNIFTPRDITRSDLIVSDRPYAGWSYLGFGIISDKGTSYDNIQLTVGVVGPSSGSELSQKRVHEWTDSQDPKGWSHQLSDELGVILRYETKWRNIYQFSPFGLAMDFTPHLGGAIGNVYTYAATGLTARIGYDLPSDFGPPRIQPSLPGSDFFVPTKQVGWYLFAGAEGRAIARNIFLDGNTFDDSHSVDRKGFVGDIQAGVAFTYGDLRIAYTHVVRSKEFKQQQARDKFGALSVSVRF